MGIATFIEETLMGLTAGIKEANQKQGNNYFRMMMNDTIDFDLAVVVSEKKEGESSGSIGIASMASVGGTSSTENQSEKTSRIRFSVKVGYNGFGAVPQQGG